MKIKEPAHAQLPLFADRSLEQKVELLYTLVGDMYAIYFHSARQRVLRILEGYTCADDEEVHNIRRIHDLVERVPNIFCQNCEIGHITGSALVVDLNTDSFLLHYHKKLDKWLQFGGHCGFGENGFEVDPADVALREAQEETGIVRLEHFSTCIASNDNHCVYPIDIDIHNIPSRKAAPEHVHLDFRYVLVVRDKSPVIQPGDGESTQFARIGFHERELHREKIDSSLFRLIGKAESLIRLAQAR